jgi:hypothetical protein
MPQKRIWLSYDLGIKGDYSSLGRRKPAPWEGYGPGMVEEEDLADYV